MNSYRTDSEQETYSLLWSREANCFHIERLIETASNGSNFFLTNQENDYLLIAYGPLKKMDQLADKLRVVLSERDEVKQLYSVNDL